MLVPNHKLAEALEFCHETFEVCSMSIIPNPLLLVHNRETLVRDGEGERLLQTPEIMDGCFPQHFQK